MKEVARAARLLPTTAGAQLSSGGSVASGGGVDSGDSVVAGVFCVVCVGIVDGCC